MNPEQLAAIERLREFEKKAMPAYWEQSENEMNLCEIKAGRNIIAKGVLTDDSSFICELVNEALPLIEALQAENERLRGFVGESFEAVAHDCEYHKAEVEQLRRREAAIKETLWPVCEYAAEIYNRGTPYGEMPPDTIRRLNSVFKRFGG